MPSSLRRRHAVLRGFGRCAALATALAAFAATAAPSAQSTPLALGFNDPDLSLYAGMYGRPVNEAALQAGLANGRAAGAQEWRLQLGWRFIASGATQAPQPLTLAADPAWSGYRWDDTDRLIRGISAAGLVPVLWPISAPTWAEGEGRPASITEAPVGTWKPSAAAYEQFARALATRYSGTYPDPATPGATLPRVRTFQAWNEPNLSTYLTPQWEKVGGRWKAYSPTHFRTLVNAFYRGVKAAQPDATVLSGGTAPFGGLYPGEPRIQPALFARELLCVAKSKGKLVGKRGCPKLRVDGWAHHTYPIGPPWRTARNADDVVVPDMAKLTKVVNAAATAGTVSRKAAKNIWMTEMSWESSPDPSGLDPATHALYMQGAFYLLWKAGVRHIDWWGSRDNAQGKDWNASFQSGVYFRGTDPTKDTPKPAFTAFRFPFAAYRVGGVAQLWAKAPGTGPVSVQVETAPNTWKTVATLKTADANVLTGKLRVNPGTNLRAVQGTDISLTWRTF